MAVKSHVLRAFVDLVYVWLSERKSARKCIKIINRQGTSKRKKTSPIVRIHLKSMSHKYTTPFWTLLPKQMCLALNVSLICSNSSSTTRSRCFRTFRSHLDSSLRPAISFAIISLYCVRICAWKLFALVSLKNLDLGILQILKQCFHYTNCPDRGRSVTRWGWESRKSNMAVIQGTREGNPALHQHY